MIGCQEVSHELRHGRKVDTLEGRHGLAPVGTVRRGVGHKVAVERKRAGRRELVRPHLLEHLLVRFRHQLEFGEMLLVRSECFTNETMKLGKKRGPYG
jgi:hypothetical protein